MNCNMDFVASLDNCAAYKSLITKEAHSSVSSSAGLDGLRKLSNKWREDANDVMAHPQDETDFPKHDVAEALINCAEELDILIKEIAA